MKTKIPTGCACIDTALEGGLSSGSVNLIYGEPETGKSTLALQCAFRCSLQGLKTLFVDCDNTFSTERLFHLAAENFDSVSEMILLMKPVDFNEQTFVVDHLEDYITKNFGLVVIDTFNSLYRAKVAEASSKTAAFTLNRELNRQMAVIAQTAKMLDVPFVVTSQVKSVFSDISPLVVPVAQRILKFWADTVISLKPTDTPSVVQAVLEKNRNTQEVSCYLRIAETGIYEYELPY
ncbi:MAG: AAA family ATPase [Candidatus Bathyarchaeota archaeon]|nr:AAA family ATPase [Candidatus Bathyarchaeota archaeon]